MKSLPKTILLATDGSTDAVLAARAAADLSKKTGAELHVAYVLHIPIGAWPAVSENYFSDYESQAEDFLAKQVGDIERLGGNVADSHLRTRSAVADEILYLAGEVNAELIVMGSRGMGRLAKLAMGSVSEGVIHQSHLPVLMLRGGEDAWPPEHVMVGEDGSEPARKVRELAAEIGQLYGSNMTLVRVYPELPKVDDGGRQTEARMPNDSLHRAEKEVGERAGEIGTVLGSRPEISISVGDAAENLVETAHEREGESTLIAVGSRGTGPIKRLRMGSISTKVLRAAEGPVLIYPS